jgi:hypothetical protein
LPAQATAIYEDAAHNLTRALSVAASGCVRFRCGRVCALRADANAPQRPQRAAVSDRHAAQHLLPLPPGAPPRRKQSQPYPRGADAWAHCMRSATTRPLSASMRLRLRPRRRAGMTRCRPLCGCASRRARCASLAG